MCLALCRALGLDRDTFSQYPPAAKRLEHETDNQHMSRLLPTSVTTCGKRHRENGLTRNRGEMSSFISSWLDKSSLRRWHWSYLKNEKPWRKIYIRISTKIRIFPSTLNPACFLPITQLDELCIGNFNLLGAIQKTLLEHTPCVKCILIIFKFRF